MNLDLGKEVEQFERQGFMGPFKLWEPDVMTKWWKQQRAKLLDPASSARKVFDNPVNYDRHLDISGLGQLISEPAIVERMQALIGPDVLCWRTEFFPKNPGDAGTGWHQVETYAIGEAEKGMLEPTERSEGVPMELTAWVAFTEATKENGCLKMIPGSHRSWKYDETRKMSWNNARKDNTFFGYDYGELRLDKNWNPDDEQVVYHEMAPGEVVLFTARCIHASNPNTSRRQRMGFAVRVVPPTVRVYGGMRRFNEFGHDFDLARHGCVLVGGKDEHGFNTMKSENEWGEPFTTLPRSS